jgi:flagellar biogenesis protein FliO
MQPSVVLPLAAWLLALRSGVRRSLRAIRQARPRPGVERLSSQLLAKGSSLHTVRWHDEELLIGCAEGQVTLLARRPAASASGEGR